jgi:LysR family hydrogen peroxide-inducible transcriptional activator
MELHQLRYFVAVAEQGSFTRAAERCFVSQPSLSQQVINLEKELGQPLIERLGRMIRLTDAGKSFYERAVRILGAVDEARECVQHETGWKEGELAVGGILTVVPYLLPDLVRAFRRRFSEAQVTVRENFTPVVVQECLSGELDLGIVALPIDDDRLVVEPLFTEELLVAIPSRHPLARRRTITLAEMAEQPFVLINELHCLGQQVVSFCRSHDCQPVISCQTAQLLTVQEMVGMGQGISLVPAMAARMDKSRLRVYRSLGDDAPRRTLAVIHHRDRRQSRLVAEFRSVLRAPRARAARKPPVRQRRGTEKT